MYSCGLQCLPALILSQIPRFLRGTKILFFRRLLFTLLYCEFSDEEVSMKKAEVFEVTYHKYLEQIADIDLLSRADILGGTIQDDVLVLPFYGEPHRVSKDGVLNATGQRATFAVCVLLCCYVLQCPETEPDPGQWVTYREFKDAGPLTGYFTSNTNKIIETTFAGQIDLLKSACREMGGRAM